MNSEAKRYRRYLSNPLVPVPRSTAWRHRTSLRAREEARDETTITDQSFVSPDVSPSRILSSSPNSHEDYTVTSPISIPEYVSEQSTLSTTDVDLSQSVSSAFDYDSTSPGVNSDMDASTQSEIDDACTDEFSNASLEQCAFLTEPLYAGSSITLGTAICAIMEFCLHNSLTYSAMDEMLKLLQVICVSPNKLPRSVFILKKFFNQFTSMNYDHHKICSKCELIPESCSCSKPSTGELLKISIDKPLKVIVSRHWSALQCPRESEGNGIISDIWDGSVMQELTKKGKFFSTRTNLAFSLSSDGVAVFKSTNLSVWPVYLVILNLPSVIRMNSENILICGLWVGPSKPPMNKLLEPVMANLKQLSTEGLVIETPNGISRIRGKLVLSIFDLPAKAPVLAMKQFNGTYGCSVCLHPGKRLSNNSRIYLPEVHEERTHDDIVTCAKQAIEDDTCVVGIKGLSPLADILDLVDCIPVDYMHACLEGIIKMLLHHWTDSRNHTKPYYIGLQVSELDKELMKQHPPSELSRSPRSINNHLNYWKASEFRSWALFYSLPLLQGKLPSLYWHHYSLFVYSLHILLKSKIVSQEIDAVERMLQDFYDFIPELYGEKSCTHNMHLVSHLCKYVRLWGPLWTHSLFGFESKNSQLKRLFHGKDVIFKQLLFNVDVNLTLQLIRHNLPDSETTQVINKFSHIALRNNMTEIGAHCYIVGSQLSVNLTREQQQALDSEQSTGKIFQRLFYNGLMFHSKFYVKEKALKRENTICSFFDETGEIVYGCIEFFLVTPEPIALVHVFRYDDITLMQRSGHPCRPQLCLYKEVDLLSTIFKSVEPVSATSRLKAVKIKDICGKPVLIRTVNYTYLVDQPNIYERH